MHFQGVAGLIVLIGIAWAASENRKGINYKGIAAGVVLQLVVAAVLLNIPVFKQIFMQLNRLVLSLEEASRAGTSFVFGYLGGAALPFEEKSSGMSYVLAFQALPLVLLVGALSSFPP
jgi:CNT family concentrative nucleoside transporter